MASTPETELLHSISLALMVLNEEDNRIVFANQTASQWLGLEWTGTGNTSFEEIFPEVRLDRLFKRLNRGRIAEFEVQYTTTAETKASGLFRFHPHGEGKWLLEGTDNAATKETEAILKSYGKIIEQKNTEIAAEKRRVERLPFNVLPQKCVSELREKGETIPERFENVTVMFVDFVGFTDLSQQMSTRELFSELNDLFSAFDSIVLTHRCERIKTIGDAYLAVCGMPEAESHHGELIVMAALKMREYIQERNRGREHQWRCRIGIHSGEVTGGVVGKLKYIYDIFGDGVNTASRMESYSEPMKINISRETRNLLGAEFQLMPRPPQEVKGKGMMEMFFVDHIQGRPKASDRILQEKPALEVESFL